MELLLRAGPPAKRAGQRALFSSPPEPAKPRRSDCLAPAQAAPRKLRRRDRCPLPLKPLPASELKGKISSAEPQTPSPPSGQGTRQPVSFQLDRSVQDPGYSCPDSFIPLSRLTGNLRGTPQKAGRPNDLHTFSNPAFPGTHSRKACQQAKVLIYEYPTPAGQRKPTNRLQNWLQYPGTRHPQTSRQVTHTDRYKNRAVVSRGK